MLVEVVFVCNVQKKRVYLCLYRSNDASSATESETVDSPASSSQTVGECSTSVSTPATSHMTPTMDDDSDHTAPYHPDVKDIETQPLKGRTLSFIDSPGSITIRGCTTRHLLLAWSVSTVLKLSACGSLTSPRIERIHSSAPDFEIGKRSPALSGACPMS